MWNAVAEYLLERCEEPILVFDGEARVLAINAALERLLGWSRSSVVGRSWAELGPADEEGQRAVAWLQSGTEGIGRRLEIPAKGADGSVLLLTMQSTHISTAEGRSIVCAVIASKPHSSSALPHGGSDEYFEISSKPETRGQLLYIWNGPSADPSNIGKPYYSVYYGREEPYLGCPAYAADARPGEIRNGVVRLGSNGENFALVKAEFTDERVRVSMRRIMRSEINELVRARVDLLAETGGLSAREQAVLGLLIEGKTAENIGDELGISPRTAKFHQTNILQKLGVDSRLDLFRLVVG